MGWASGTLQHRVTITAFGFQSTWQKNVEAKLKKSQDAKSALRGGLRRKRGGGGAERAGGVQVQLRRVNSPSGNQPGSQSLPILPLWQPFSAFGGGEGPN